MCLKCVNAGYGISVVAGDAGAGAAAGLVKVPRAGLDFDKPCVPSFDASIPEERYAKPRLLARTVIQKLENQGMTL